MYTVVRLLQESKLYAGMICVVQHNTKTCIICTCVAWLALPAAIVLNDHLALIATCDALHLMEAYYMNYT